MMWLLQFPLVLGDNSNSPVFFTDIFFSFIKVMFIMAGLLYVAFAVVVLRQIYVMHESLVTSLSGIFKLLGFIHLLLSLLVLVYYLLVL
jgi:hypothetical protein